MKTRREARTRAIAKGGIALATAVTMVAWGVVPADAWWRLGPYWAYPYYGPPVVVEPPVPPVIVQPSPPPVVVQPQAPPVYVAPDDSTAHESYYYYCESSKAYYPYVKECLQGWTRVAPQPKPGA